MAYIRNVEDDGAWEAGGTYTFEVYRAGPPYGFGIGALHISDPHDCLFTEACKDWLIANPLDPALLEFPNLDGWEGYLDFITLIDNGTAGSGGDSQISEATITEDGGWDAWSTVTVVISEDAEDGTYYLLWGSVTGNGDPDLDETEVYEITTSPSGPAAFDPPLPSGVTLDGDGNPTGTPTGENNMITIKRLVAVGYNKIYYGGTGVSAGDMSTELSTVDYAIDTSDQLNMFEAYQKVFVVNGAVLGVADFVNTKITDDNGFTTKPARGDIVYQAGASAATMVVDYINSTDKVMYGYVTSGIFEITTAITSAVGGGGNVIFPSPVAGLAKPRWYAWTPYDNDTDTYGSMPAKAYLGCLYRGRCVLAGNPNYPHQWYMSKIGDPWNWVYSSTDPLTAVAGNNADAGEIGDIVRALIPYKDDYLIFGCASTIWVLTGDPAHGGSIDEIDSTVGMFGANSWCFDSDGNIYFFGTNGIYKIPLGFRSVENLTEISIPNLVKDEDVSPSTHRITMGYDRKRHGILICITKLSDGDNSNYWYDLKLKGFYPEDYPDECGAYSLFYYAANDNDYADLLVGGKDGYIRNFEETSTGKNDDAGASGNIKITSYAVWPIQHLTEDNDKEGKLTSLTIELAGGLATTKLTHDELTTAHLKGDILTQATVWADNEDYVVGNVVVYNGIYYICMVEHTSNEEGGDGTGGTPDGNPTDWTVTTVATMIVVFSNTAKTLTFGHLATGTFTILGGGVTGSGSGTAFTPTAVGTGAFGDTDGVSYEIHVGDDAETVIEKIKDGVAPHSSGLLSGAGRKNRIRTRVRGAWLGLKMINSTISESWSVNKIFGTTMEVGRIK